MHSSDSRVSELSLFEAARQANWYIENKLFVRYKLQRPYFLVFWFWPAVKTGYLHYKISPPTNLIFNLTKFNEQMSLLLTTWFHLILSALTQLNELKQIVNSPSLAKLSKLQFNLIILTGLLLRTPISSVQNC